MATLTTIEELLIHCVRDLYSAETQLVDALPQMAQAATEPALAQAFTTHLADTRNHLVRLDQVADLLGSPPHGATCLGMQGLVAEGQEILKSSAEPAVKDLALSGAARKVEHYEIAAYCGAKELAEALGNQEVVALLQTTEDEEKSTERLLMALAAKVVGRSPVSSDPVAR